jgi:hypothetical protein
MVFELTKLFRFTADRQRGTLMGTNRAPMIWDAGNPTELLKVSAEGTILVKNF